MILKERGLLNFTDIISQHLPELEYHNITIEHLMHHTAGIQNYTNFPENYVAEQGADFMPMSVFFEIIEDYPLTIQFEPGSRWNYSNSSYILLAEIVSRTSGLSFADFIHYEFSMPLGMNNRSVFNLLSDSNDGEKIISQCVARLMKSLSIESKMAKKFVITTHTKNTSSPAPVL